MTVTKRKDIRYTREDRLHKELSSLSYKRDRLLAQIKREKMDDVLEERLQCLEVDICYVYREIEHRAHRKEAHRNFLRNNAQKNRANRANRHKNSV